MTIGVLLTVMRCAQWIQICSFGRTYQIPTFQLPKKILDLEIESIDSPEFTSEIHHPLCVNINPETWDGVHNWEQFQIDYAHYIYW